MIDLSKISASLKQRFSKDLAVKMIVIAGILGMVLILISQFTQKSNPTPTTRQTPVDTNTAELISEDYTQKLEDKMRLIITSIDGVGIAQVLITLENGSEFVYAKEEKSSVDKTIDPSTGEQAAKETYKQDIQYNYVMIETDYGKKQALIKTQLQPKVQGVVIVCEGADNAVVRQNLINVVTTALNIPTTRVCVVKINKAG